MDTQIAIWEMSLEPQQVLPSLQEKIALDPSEPYILDRTLLNWN